VRRGKSREEMEGREGGWKGKEEGTGSDMHAAGIHTHLRLRNEIYVLKQRAPAFRRT
jgi:hypothetical protein